MLPDRVSNPGSLTYESGALPIALRGQARLDGNDLSVLLWHKKNLDKSVCSVYLVGYKMGIFRF